MVSWAFTGLLLGPSCPLLEVYGGPWLLQIRSFVRSFAVSEFNKVTLLGLAEDERSQLGSIERPFRVEERVTPTRHDAREPLRAWREHLPRDEVSVYDDRATRAEPIRHSALATRDPAGEPDELRGGVGGSRGVICRAQELA